MCGSFEGIENAEGNKKVYANPKGLSNKVNLDDLNIVAKSFPFRLWLVNAQDLRNILDLLLSDPDFGFLFSIFHHFHANVDELILLAGDD